MVNAVFGLLIKDDVTPMIMGGARSGKDEIRVPLVGLESKDIKNIKKQLHAAVEACCNSYKTHKCGFVSDGYK
jgi:hypothetical protein